MTVHSDDSATANAEKGESLPHRRGVSGGQVAAWAFAFLLLRIFAVAGYDWDTAFLVSTTIGLDDGLALMFGSLMANYLLTAVLLICLLPLLMTASLWGAKENRLVVTLLAVLGVVVLITLTRSHHVWWLPLATAAVLVTLVLIRRLPSTNPLHRSAVTALTKVGRTTAVAALIVAGFAQTPWVPQEVIQTADASITGYVLSVDSGYLNVLTEDHEFVIVPSSEVESRE